MTGRKSVGFVKCISERVRKSLTHGRKWPLEQPSPRVGACVRSETAKTACWTSRWPGLTANALRRMVCDPRGGVNARLAAGDGVPSLINRSAGCTPQREGWNP